MCCLIHIHSSGLVRYKLRQVQLERVPPMSQLLALLSRSSPQMVHMLLHSPRVNPCENTLTAAIRQEFDVPHIL